MATLPVPPTPTDGDCLTWALASADRLAALGFHARAIDVTGWVDPQTTMQALRATSGMARTGVPNV